MEVISKIEGDQVLVLELNQDSLDASNVREFRETVHGLIQKRSRVVFDMTKLQFVDSSGLGALISCQRVLKSQHGQFRLCAMSVPVLALFDLMRMNRVFQIHLTRNEAILAFKVGEPA